MHITTSGVPPNTRLAAIRRHLAASGTPGYRYDQVAQAVLRRGVAEFDAMTELPRPVRRGLRDAFGDSVALLRPLAVESGRQVDRILFESSRGGRVETVVSRYRAGWTSVCLSSQIGCGLGCTFCATGAVGLVRNLSADEICDQVLYVRRQERVDSLAFMGMGEPLANPHTFDALNLLTAPGLIGMSERRVTVSTVGFLPGLQRLVDRYHRLTVTLSVHSPFDEERRGLIPLQERFPLRECLDVLDDRVGATGRKAYLAYLLIDAVNDSDEHLRALAALVRERRHRELFHVSVIPYNEAVGVRPAYRSPPPARVTGFVAGLRARGVAATCRQQFGAAEGAGCGQLHARYLRRSP